MVTILSDHHESVIHAWQWLRMLLPMRCRRRSRRLLASRRCRLPPMRRRRSRRSLVAQRCRHCCPELSNRTRAASSFRSRAMDAATSSRAVPAACCSDPMASLHPSIAAVVGEFVGDGRKKKKGGGTQTCGVCRRGDFARAFARKNRHGEQRIRAVVELPLRSYSGRQGVALRSGHEPNSSSRETTIAPSIGNQNKPFIDEVIIAIIHALSINTRAQAPVESAVHPARWHACRRSSHTCRHVPP
jgi:hypothetical protein